MRVDIISLLIHKFDPDLMGVGTLSKSHNLSHLICLSIGPNINYASGMSHMLAKLHVAPAVLLDCFSKNKVGF